MKPRAAVTRLLLLAAGLATFAAATADAPVIRPRPDGLLELDPPPSGAIVRYTMDGSEPGQGAGVWLSPVNLPPGYTLKARMFSAGRHAMGDIDRQGGACGRCAYAVNAGAGDAEPRLAHLRLGGTPCRLCRA